jgi:purine nucleosidase
MIPIPGTAPDGSVLYTRYLSGLRGASGSLVFPHALTNGEQAREAVSLLRETLSNQPDKSVVLIQIGPSTNLSRLLDTRADVHSDLDGLEPVKKKVRFLAVMAGVFDDVSGFGQTYRRGTPEANILMDIGSAQRLFESWPTELIASGLEIGASIVFPGCHLPA